MSKKRNLGSLLKGAKESSTLSWPSSPLEQVQREIEKYLRSPDLDEESNRLEWWKLNCCQFEILAKLARKYLIICETSCASERLFSTSGKIVTPLRSHLKPDNVYRQTCIFSYESLIPFYHTFDYQCDY